MLEQVLLEVGGQDRIELRRQSSHGRLIVSEYLHRRVGLGSIGNCPLQVSMYLLQDSNCRTKGGVGIEEVLIKGGFLQKPLLTLHSHAAQGKPCDEGREEKPQG